MSGPEPPQLTWMLTSDAWPNARWPRGPDFTAFHGELLVGRVFQHQDGPEKGLWFWTMSVERSVWPSPARPAGLSPSTGKPGGGLSKHTTLCSSVVGTLQNASSLSRRRRPRQKRNRNHRTLS